LFLKDSEKFEFLVNGVSFVLPSVPVLLQILSGAKLAQDLLPSGSIIPLPPGKVVEVTIPAGVVGGEVRRSMFFFRKC
jgi:iron transport multicopper oxidase